MNKQRRKEINKLIDQVESAKAQLADLKETITAIREKSNEILEAEQEYFGNIPEALQGGEKGTASSESIELLVEATEALDTLDEALCDFDVDECISKLDEAKGGPA